ncbi:hypothetical protein BT69DRAFT_1283730 [Atractiella rhizophila]|nr:hypothetical protein BT69DRAFT_1283730 [Atractiella rhizophila]
MLTSRASNNLQATGSILRISYIGHTTRRGPRLGTVIGSPSFGCFAPSVSSNDLDLQ